MSASFEGCRWPILIIASAGEAAIITAGLIGVVYRLQYPTSAPVGIAFCLVIFAVCSVEAGVTTSLILQQLRDDKRLRGLYESLSKDYERVVDRLPDPDKEEFT